MLVDGKEARGLIEQTANDVDHVKCLWSPNRNYVGHARSIILTGNQLQQDLRRWLSPQDPSTNHNIASSAHCKGTTTWFFEGTTYKEWKSTGSESLLWIHGKRVPLSHSTALRHLITSLICICSWLWQEHNLVRKAFTAIVNDN
jgi:hypothetical protein